MLLVLLLLLIAVCSWFIANRVYRVQVRREYKTPMATAILVFILSFVILTGGILLLILSQIQISR